MCVISLRALSCWHKVEMGERRRTPKKVEWSGRRVAHKSMWRVLLGMRQL